MGNRVYGHALLEYLEKCAGLEAGYFGLFAKYGQPPGWRYGEWDFRPEWDYFSERNEDIEVKFDASQPAWQQGIVNLPLSLALIAPQDGLPLLFSACGSWRNHASQPHEPDWAMCCAGQWFVGVNGDDSSTCKYTISISKYNCPMNCNDRGTCLISDNGTRTCDCNKVSLCCVVICT